MVKHITEVIHYIIVLTCLHVIESEINIAVIFGLNDMLQSDDIFVTTQRLVNQKKD